MDEVGHRGGRRASAMVAEAGGRRPSLQWPTHASESTGSRRLRPCFLDAPLPTRARRPLGSSSPRHRPEGPPATTTKRRRRDPSPPLRRIRSRKVTSPGEISGLVDAGETPSGQYITTRCSGQPHVVLTCLALLALHARALRRGVPADHRAGAGDVDRDAMLDCRRLPSGRSPPALIQRPVGERLHAWPRFPSRCPPP